MRKCWYGISHRIPKSGEGLTTKITDTIVTEEAEEEVIRTEKVRTEKKTIPETLHRRRIVWCLPVKRPAAKQRLELGWETLL